MSEETKPKDLRNDKTGSGQSPAPGEPDEETPSLENEEKAIRVLGFRLGDEEYAIDIMRIKEVTAFFAPTPIPRAPEYVLGILSLRGNIIPLFDPKIRLGFPDTGITEKTRIIVLKKGEEQVGIVVDATTSAVRVPTSRIEPPPPVIRGVDAEYLQGVVREGERMIIIMNLDEVIRMGEKEGTV